MGKDTKTPSLLKFVYIPVAAKSATGKNKYEIAKVETKSKSTSLKMEAGKSKTKKMMVPEIRVKVVSKSKTVVKEAKEKDSAAT